MQPQGPQDGHLVVADHRPANGGFMIYVHMAGLITQGFQNSRINFTVIIQFVMSKGDSERKRSGVSARVIMSVLPQ